jgi:parallel beta-helix repeat protein
MNVGSTVFLIAAATIGLCLHASAADHYVATSGSDANPGTKTHPWAALQHAVDSIGPGDTIRVASGSYAGFRITSSGRRGAPCTVKAETGAKVLVNAAGPKSLHGSFIEAQTDGTVSHWVIEGLEVAGSAGYGIDLRRTSHMTVRNCYTHHSRVTGLYDSHSDHTSFLDNETAYNGEHGIYHANSGDYPIIRGNTSHHNAGCGIQMNADLSQGDDGIIHAALVERNVIYENGAGGSGSAINASGQDHSIFRNNLIYGNHARGISLFAGDSAIGSRFCMVLNNTLVFASDGNDLIIIPGSTDPKKPSPLGNVVMNNILYTANPQAAAIRAYGPEAFASSGCDHNIVIGRFRMGDEGVLGLREWQARGFDRHSLLGEPGALFVAPSHHDYHLRPGSPAARAGIALGEVEDDLAGRTRPRRSPCDAGCYQDSR